MTVYAKTAEGRLAAFDPQSTLPPAVKALLRRVDGKQSCVDLTEHFHQLRLGSEWGNAGALLEVLTIRNLVRVQPKRLDLSSEAWVAPQKRPLAVVETPGAERQGGPNGGPVTGVAPDHPALNEAAATATVGGAADPSGALGWQGLPEAPPSVAGETLSKDQVTSARELMATFLLTYMPRYALGLLQDIESIDSGHQLLSTLDAYAHVARQAGREGVVHLRELRRITGSHWLG